MAIDNNMCFVFARPINMSIKLVAPTSKAVDKFAGAISAQIIMTGVMIGKKPFLKSLITFCLRLS